MDIKHIEEVLKGDAKKALGWAKDHKGPLLVAGIAAVVAFILLMYFMPRKAAPVIAAPSSGADMSGDGNGDGSDGSGGDDSGDGGDDGGLGDGMGGSGGGYIGLPVIAPVVTTGTGGVVGGPSQQNYFNWAKPFLTQLSEMVKSTAQTAVTTGGGPSTAASANEQFGLGGGALTSSTTSGAGNNIIAAPPVFTSGQSGSGPPPVNTGTVSNLPAGNTSGGGYQPTTGVWNLPAAQGPVITPPVKQQGVTYTGGGGNLLGGHNIRGKA